MKAFLIRYVAISCMVLASSTSFAGDILQVEMNKGAMVKLEGMASSIVVADPATADVQVVSPKLIFVRGKKVGETSLFVMDGKDNTIYEASVEVTHNLGSLDRTVKRLAPNSDVSFKTLNGGLVMDGFASSIAESENIRNIASAYVGADSKMVNMIATNGSDQVMLKVKIIEMLRSDIKKFGINLQNAFTVGGVNLQLLQGSDISIDTNSTIGGVEVDRAGLLDRRGGLSNGILGRWGGGRHTSMIDALETQGLVNVLAEPTLTTTSGKSASFLAGGEFPIPVKDGNGSVTVNYKPFGVSLKFTPVVMDKERMSIDVAPEVSTINFNNPIEVSGVKNPIIDTRKAQATIELGSGQTFALAGLLKREDSNSISKLPGVGDVPVLGALFSSKQYMNNQTELVILVTPYIVRPVSNPKALQTPLDGFKPPSDFERLLFGSLYQQESMDDQKPVPEMPLNGEGGYIVEPEE